ncbi:MAG TPA: beta-phosphoglucomutase [Anaerolineae bacterium]|nr:beta-phosphoglucomutase [Anaerolineae bacterium]HOR00414.1 beta-phosphoglucomutase [Anaerolineae bacterium]
MRAIGAAIFDLDGVLTDTAEYHYRAWKRLADELGIAFSRADNEALRGVSRHGSLELLLKGRPVTEDEAQALMERKNAYYVALIGEITPADLLPGAEALLGELRTAGLRVAVATVSRNARTVLDNLRLWPCLDAMVSGAEAQRSKPAPDLFLCAAARLGMPPSRCLVLEDAAAGIAAAEAAGMRAVAIGPAERFAQVRPEVILPSLAGVSWGVLTDRLAEAEAAAATWTVREPAFDPATLRRQESVLTIGNGFLGTRGSFEERCPGDQPATLINGLFDDVPIVHSELAAVPDWLGLRLTTAGERCSLEAGRLLAYERTLDMRDGLLRRTMRWQSPQGRTVELRFERWASLNDVHLCALRCAVTALDFAGEIEIAADIDGTVENPGTLAPAEVGLHHWRTLSHGNPTAQTATLHVRTRVSGAELAVAMHLAVAGVPQAGYRPLDSAHAPGVAARVHLEQGETAVATKLVYFDCGTGFPARPSSPADLPQSAGLGRAGEPVPTGAGLIERLEADVAAGYDSLLAAHRAAWRDLWRDCDIQIDGDDAAQRGVRFNLYQLLIAVPRHTGRVSIPAKTLSGFGYRGHVFWDTDIFVIPFFAHTRPELARNLLRYRYHTLPGARDNARRAGYQGAMYAWESAGDGRETTPRWVPLADGELVRIWCGDIEQHITANVAYAVWHYWQVTGDDAFMRDYGAEILLDTAAFWGSRAERNEAAGRYEIRDVIGPDEYHEHVDNNAYTNRLVQWHLERALEMLGWLRAHHSDKAAELAARLDLSAERLAHWRDVAQQMHIPYDPATGLFEQFAGFFRLPEVDWPALEGRTRSIQSLLGIAGAQQVQALKQADVLMLYFLGVEGEERALQANWDYYEPRTDHTYGSSLGPAVHALLACRLGRAGESYRHFARAAFVDLEDLRGNTSDGIHAASAGGVWQVVVMGFAGMRATPDGPTFTPRLPQGWQRLRFTVRERGRRHEVDLCAG